MFTWWFLCCSCSMFVRLWFHMWRFFLFFFCLFFYHHFSSSLRCLVPLESYASWLLHFLGIFTYSFQKDCQLLHKVGHNRDNLRSTAWLLIHLVENFASIFNCKIVSWSAAKMTAVSLISLKGCCLTITVCDLAQRGPVCGFLVFWLVIAILFFLLVLAGLS